MTVHVNDGLRTDKRLVSFTNALHVPGFARSGGDIQRLLSQRVAQFASRSHSPTFLFGPHISHIDYGNFRIKLDTQSPRNLYTLHTQIHVTFLPDPKRSPHNGFFHAAAATVTTTLAQSAHVAICRNLLHRRLDHISDERLGRCIKNDPSIKGRRQ